MSKGLAQMRQAANFVFDNYINGGQMPSLPPILGTWYHVVPGLGASTRSGKSKDNCFDVLYDTSVGANAYNSCTSGAGDGIVLWAYGLTTAGCTSYLEEALTWSKWGITVVGICAPTLIAQRARVANKSTTFENGSSLITVSGSNNAFYNVSFYNGGTTGTGCITVTGNRNYFGRCHILGAAGVTSAGTSDNDLTLTGASENTFESCVIGSDTKDRGNNASAGVHFGSGCMRNFFIDCLFLRYQSSGTGGAAIKMDGAGDAIYRNQYFKGCIFDCYDEANAAANTVAVIGTAPNNGRLLMDTNCVANGYVDWAAAGIVVGAQVAAAAAKGGIVADQAA